MLNLLIGNEICSAQSGFGRAVGTYIDLSVRDDLNLFKIFISGISKNKNMYVGRHESDFKIIHIIISHFYHQKLNNDIRKYEMIYEY